MKKRPARRFAPGTVMPNRLLLALLATTCLAGPAFAQASATPQTTGTAPGTQTSADGQVAGLEHVVVTARKREEEAQAVPISITALSQADLDKLSVKTIEDLKYVSPSV